VGSCSSVLQACGDEARVQPIRDPAGLRRSRGLQVPPLRLLRRTPRQVCCHLSTIIVPSLCHHCAIIVPSLNHHCAISQPSLCHLFVVYRRPNIVLSLVQSSFLHLSATFPPPFHRFCSLASLLWCYGARVCVVCGLRSADCGLGVVPRVGFVSSCMISFLLHLRLPSSISVPVQSFQQLTQLSRCCNLHACRRIALTGRARRSSKSHSATGSVAIGTLRARVGADFEFTVFSVKRPWSLFRAY
jgi:hypothetical protein